MNLTRLLLQISVVLMLCRLLHGLLRRMGQPPVMGEIIAGLLLGPSFFGWLAPSWFEQLFTSTSLPMLNGLAQIGLVLFMFLVGLRLDLDQVTVFRKVAGLVGVSSIAVPFIAGLALAWPLHAFAPSSPMLPFSLFIAVAMSITAFPVLARILSDQHLAHTRLGQLAIACAAFNDVAAWTLLAWVTAVAHSSTGDASIVRTIATLSAYGLAMAFAVRPALRRLTLRFPAASELQVMLVVALLSSWATESIGIHAFFGAFFAGVIWPRDKAFFASGEVLNNLEAVTMTVLVPLFFSYSGLRTNLGSIAGADAWTYTAVLIIVAVLSKIGGAFLGGIAVGFGARQSLALGTLLNTRGLVELIALNVGLDLGILSPALFSMLGLMAVLTTLMTVPLLSRILPEEAVSAERPEYCKEA